MRASVAISILVSLAALHLPSTFLLPVVAQPAAPGSAAVEAFRAYVDQILEPAVSSRPLSEDRLRRFYQTRLAVETQTKVGEEEFVEFWGELSRRYAHVSLRAALRYEIEQVLEGDGQDQTLVLARFAIDHLAGGEHLFKMPMHALLGCLPGLESNVRPPAECARDFRPTGEGWSWYYTLYRVVRESDGWKIALQGGLIQEIRRTAPRVISRRFEPGTVARGRELTLRVREVLLRSDRTVLGLSIENAGDVEIQVLNPLSLASLRDEKGAAYNTRLLASTIPETVARHSSTLAQLVFDPVPLDSRKLFLDVSDILVGDEVFSLRADISLETVRQAPVTPAPVAGEPLLLYLVSVSRLWLNDAPAYAALYEQHLAERTRTQLAADRFIAYHQAEATERWMCAVGYPSNFALGKAAYNAAKDQATIEVRWLDRAKGIVPDVTVFRVLKERGAWRLDLTDAILNDMKVWQPLPKTYDLNGKASYPRLGSIEVHVNKVQLQNSETRVEINISNPKEYAVRVKQFGITDRRRDYGPPFLGGVFERALNPDAKLVPAKSTRGVELSVRPLPLETRKFRLDVRVGEDGSDKNNYDFRLDVDVGCP